MNQEEIDQTVKFLRKLKPGFLPQEIFYEFARLYVSPILEIVPLRKSTDGRIFVLALERASTDPHWPEVYHIPGTVFRATDDDINSTINRLLKSELPELNVSGDPVFVSYEFHKVKRGSELALVFYIEYEEKPGFGREIASEELESNILDTQISYVQKAIERFEHT